MAERAIASLITGGAAAAAGMRGAGGIGGDTGACTIVDHLFGTASYGLPESPGNLPQVALLLQPECVARCAAAEVLALDHWAHVTSASMRCAHLSPKVSVSNTIVSLAALSRAQQGRLQGSVREPRLFISSALARSCSMWHPLCAFYSL